MSYTAEGTIEIPLEDFFGWVYTNYSPCYMSGVEFQHGVPRVNKSNNTIEVDFAMGTDCNPAQWKEKPKFMEEWKS
jgi:hypothetical protein